MRNVYLIFKTEYVVMSEICLLKGENDGLLQGFGYLLKIQNECLC